MLLLSMSGCTQGNNDTTNKDRINVYFYSEQTKGLDAHQVEITLQSNAPAEKKVIAVLEALSQGPQVANQVSKPMNLYIKDSSLKEKIVTIIFDEKYMELDVETQMINRASIVYSLTDLEFIEAVEFFVGDKPLMTNYGTKIGKVSRKDFLISIINPNPPTTTQTITLYFAKEGEDKLYKEERTINTNNNTPLEKYVVEELIKGPTTEGLLPILPSDTKVNDVKTQEFICQVDLSYKLVGDATASPIKDELVIYSLVNSLTEIPSIQKVIFLTNGQKQTEIQTDTSVSGLFERNEEIIANTK